MDLSNSSRRMRFVDIVTYTHTHTYSVVAQVLGGAICVVCTCERDGNTLVSVMIKVLEGTADYLDNKSIVTAVRLFLSSIASARSNHDLAYKVATGLS